MIVQFDPVYLTNADEPANRLISEWHSDVHLDPFDESTNVVVLPPTKPDSLKILIELCDSDMTIGDRGQFIIEVLRCLENGSTFWEDQLLYDSKFSIEGHKIHLKLKCKIWSSEKVSVLLQKPVERRPYMNNFPFVSFLKQLRVFVKFHHPSCTPLNVSDVVAQLNEYISSLFISQLEFRFPFVFSTTARKRFQSQESDIGPLSYALTNSSTLLPILTKLICDDNTATTAYKLVSYTKKKRTGEISFSIAMENNND